MRRLDGGGHPGGVINLRIFSNPRGSDSSAQSAESIPDISPFKIIASPLGMKAAIPRSLASPAATTCYHSEERGGPSRDNSPFGQALWSSGDMDEVIRRQGEQDLGAPRPELTPQEDLGVMGLLQEHSDEERRDAGLEERLLPQHKPTRPH